MAIRRTSNTEPTFVEDIPDKFNCGICTNVLRNPRLTECCGQHFCKACLESWLKKHGNKTCPHCRGQNFNHMLDKSVQREINQLKVYCSHHEEGCQWVEELGDLQTHLDSQKGCGYVKVNCPNCDTELFSSSHIAGHKVLRKNLQQHLQSECHLRKYNCGYCGHANTYEFITQTHYASCLQFPLKCPNKCGIARVHRRRMPTHREQCPLEQVPCPFQEAGCETKLVRRDLEKHLSQEMQHHLLLTYKAMCTLKERCSELEKKVK